jgi:hypothetical protein
LLCVCGPHHISSAFKESNFQPEIMPSRMVRGIGMFNFLHVAPNGIELHPGLNIAFNLGAAALLNGAVQWEGGRDSH